MKNRAGHDSKVTAGLAPWVGRLTQNEDKL